MCCKSRLARFQLFPGLLRGSRPDPKLRLPGVQLQRIQPPHTGYPVKVHVSRNTEICSTSPHDRYVDKVARARLVACIRHSGGRAYVLRIGRLDAALEQDLESTEDFPSDHPPVCPPIVVGQFLQHLGICHEMRGVIGYSKDNADAGIPVFVLSSGCVNRNVSVNKCHRRHELFPTVWIIRQGPAAPPRSWQSVPQQPGGAFPGELPRRPGQSVAGLLPQRWTPLLSASSSSRPRQSLPSRTSNRLTILRIPSVQRYT